MIDKKMIQNETIANILTRVTVRNFTDEPVSDRSLRLLLQAAMAAPSSMNLQPWHFIVIRDESLKRILKDSLPYARMINRGCAGIVVCGDTSLYEHINRTDREDNTLYWVQDCSAASENLLLAAHAIGLGAVWTGVWPLQSRVDRLRGLLDIPGHVVPLNLILVGHPVSLPLPKEKWDEKKLHYDRF